jgi:glutamyl-Q tRNA(Asp) synthetase
VAALASWLDARAHQGLWLVRIEDVDTTRCLPGMAHTLLQQLAACGLHSDLTPIFQTPQLNRYQAALDTLISADRAYPCGCSRKDIERKLQDSGHDKTRHAALIYPGTCRTGLQGKAPRAWRFKTDNFIRNRPLAHTECGSIATTNIANFEPKYVHWSDRKLGPQWQNVATEVGDFILKRADGCFAYQLAVVVDDAAQGITDVVRGADLTDNTARQILLQHALGLPTPRYLHAPLVLGHNGEKLSKQNGAQALNTDTPLAALNQAAHALGLAPQSAVSVSEALANWVAPWRALVG